jgi:formate/nitrite transporter FocA (FNT family)
LVRGLFAGWLIALLVWVLPGAPDSRFPVITVISYVVGAAGLSHIIAGSIEVLTTVAAGERTWSEYVVGFLVPVFIGNTVGGIGLVSLLNYGQVATEGPQRDAAQARRGAGKTAGRG